MTTEYAWVVSQMDTKPQEGELADVVSVIHWRRQARAVDGENTYFADTYGATSFPAPSETDFTTYADLTFEQVCAWLDTVNDVEAINANLDAQIEKSINPPVVSYALPWITVAPAEEIPVVE